MARFRQQMADHARGEKLKTLRNQRRLNQEDAAHEIGVSAKTLRAWEKGGPIKWENAKAAASFYEVDAEGLVEREPGASLKTAEPDDGDLRLEMAALRNELLGELAVVQDALAKQRSLLETVLRNQEGGS